MNWDSYWTNAQRRRHGLYEIVAEFYRRQIISRAAAIVLARYFPDACGRQYLHAGCGSGGSDQRLPLRRARIHALDLSVMALQLSQARRMPFAPWHVCGDLFHLPYTSGSMDGVFNFGVMEHFTEEDIEKILAEFRRVLKPDGYVVLFWPPDFGLSVMVLGSFAWLVSRFRKEPLQFYPDEISRVKSFPWIRSLMARNRFRVTDTEFGWRDLFTYVVVVGRPVEAEGSPGTRWQAAAPQEVAALTEPSR